MSVDRPAFVHNALDRAEHIRKDADALAKLQRSASAQIALFQDGKPFLFHGRNGALDAAFLTGPALEALAPQRVVFLGLEGERPVFAADLDAQWRPPSDFPLTGLGDFQELRGALGALPPADQAILGTARSLLLWHRDHGFCAVCGAPSHSVDGGWKRRCPNCGAEHFPRVNPVVIMAITDGERLLLGRQAGWPPQMFSCLAGFVEPGETLAAAANREAQEEAGVRLTAARPLLEQPWPFPSSLMIGLMAHTDDHDAQADGVELEAVRWFTRAEVAELVNERHGNAAIPPTFTIARRLIHAFVETPADALEHIFWMSTQP